MKEEKELAPYYPADKSDGQGPADVANTDAGSLPLVRAPPALPPALPLSFPPSLPPSLPPFLPSSLPPSRPPFRVPAPLPLGAQPGI
jgi:hypothetical protein